MPIVNQTCQGGDSLQGAPTQKLVWLLNEVDKSNTLYLHLQRTHGEETRQTADLP